MKILGTHSRGLKVAAAALTAIASCLTFLVPAQPASAADARANIVGTDYDQDGNKVILRQGVYSTSKGTGFGWVKIMQRHNIHDKDTLGFVIHEPYPDYQGTKIQYNAYANELINGEIVDRREVIVVYQRRNAVDYYGVRINGRIGILTAYCINPGSTLPCPSWVDTALGRRTAAGGSQTVWSYEPHAIGSTPAPSDYTRL